jgi:hypothetical protein
MYTLQKGRIKLNQIEYSENIIACNTYLRVVLIFGSLFLQTKNLCGWASKDCIFNCTFEYFLQGSFLQLLFFQYQWRREIHKFFCFLPVFYTDPQGFTDQVKLLGPEPTN